MTTTIVESLVEGRLRPIDSASKKQSEVVEGKQVHYHSKNLLIRASSFDCIRQFPTNFCRQSSAEIVTWLASSKIRLSSYLPHFSKQLHGSLLAISVYSVATLLTIQLFIAILTLLTVSVPPLGFLFLIACLLFISYLGLRIFTVNKPIKISQNRKSRTRQQLSRHEEKKIK